MNKLLRIFLFAIFHLFAIACVPAGLAGSAVQPFSVPPMLQPGDQIDDMRITTGAREAAPLWQFCVPTTKNDHLIVVDCGQVSFPRLAIGYTFGVMDLVTEEPDWSELNWELYIDGQPIDLGSFGIYHFIYPDMPLAPSRIREVFRSAQIWDVVLEDVVPGAHVVYGHARFGDQTYTWIVNFMAAANRQSIV